MALTLEGVSKSVGGRVHIHPTDLTLARGTMNVLLGPTLAGKTSLMRLMAGLDAPTSGRVLWEGADVTGKRVQDRGVAMVYQQFINYPAMTVFENIASPLRLQGRPKDEIRRRVGEVAELMKLTPMLDRRPLELSGGQQQRCALARALVKDAGLVLLDEPLANLDYKLREELRIEIPRIFEASGAIFVYATTEPEEALLLGGNTATLHEGRVTQFGPTPEVYRQPVDMITARTFSDPPLNVLGVTKRGERVAGEGEGASLEL
ncbi:MAG: ABC transporter ATP-binding protein, partial [Albimonas sp.]|uniref:ABC transporter ATP-binding protein n=1 Tax=Albimonas sp. TaxID=1872425 RepID=UPI004057BD8B